MRFLEFLFPKKDTTKWFKLFDNEQEAEKNIQLDKAITVEINEFVICLARTSKGYFAVADQCPHHGASLSKGICTVNNEIKCPVHGYNFDLKTGKESGNRDEDIKVFKVDIRKNGFFIGVS